MGAEVSGPDGGGPQARRRNPQLVGQHPLAIAMWDFSWLERRWPGGGYENWDRALEELVERGYDAVRIDAFPHLYGVDGPVVLLPVWTEPDWGSPRPVTVTVRPALLEFVARCRDRGVAVALSTWFREDIEDRRMGVTTPEAMDAICGPQYRGMWGDVAWHQRMTREIRLSPVDPALVADSLELRRCTPPLRRRTRMWSNDRTTKLEVD